MSAMQNATDFFHACDSAKGWDECSQYVAEGASFHAQSEPLVDITTVEGYANWMAGFGENVVPGSSYEIHTSAYDDASRTAIFFATFTGKHTGDGGPIPPTNKETEVCISFTPVILPKGGTSAASMLLKVLPFMLKANRWSTLQL